ncbi:trypsin-like peptidase domain-containing protein, partial [Streptomyces sp. YIM 98790]|uniref:trypsin-like peptidase domain-containing protein n=1 Tax=Streptomyces sp. YIM 98790 TaxID=2689077 RepID=UPI001A9FF008
MTPAKPSVPSLVRISDLAGRSRGSGFLADHQGTVLTSHEAVDGLPRVVLRSPSGRTEVIEAGDITPVPEWNLALLRTRDLDVEPLVCSTDRAAADLRVRVRLGGWLTTAVSGACPATYTATDRFHSLPVAVELDLPESAGCKLRLNTAATGSPVLDAQTGSVLAVLGTALHTAHRSAGFAVPLRAAAEADPGGPVDRLLRRNGATVPGFGVDLNVAGVLELTAAAVHTATAAHRAPPADRREAAEALRSFERGDASLLALVGPPGTGRTTALAAHAARRLRGPEPAVTLWLTGADLHADDSSVRDALARALGEAGRAHAAAGPATVGDPARVDPDVVARIARDTGTPLLVLLDAPEEMPRRLLARLRPWITGTVSWLRAAGARLALTTRPEFWDHSLAPLLPPPAAVPPAPASGREAAAEPREGRGRGDAPRDHAAGAGTHRPTSGTTAGAEVWGRGLVAHVELGDLPAESAVEARAALGITPGRIAPEEAAHPLSLRLLSRVRAAQGRGADGAPGRIDIFSAHLDLCALTVASRLVCGGHGPARLRDQCRLAARVSARLHEAARRCLGPVVLPRRDFEELFPRQGGWARAVLDSEILLPAGSGYRFADEEFAEWLQGCHLDLDVALDRLLAPRPGEEAIPRHRIGPVVFALLTVERRYGPDALRRRLQRLVDALPGVRGQAAPWWAGRLLGEVLPRLADASPYTGPLHQLAERIGADRLPPAGFGPSFWRRLALPVADRLALLRLLLPADTPGADRYLTVAAEQLAADPATAQRALCRWFGDERPLRRSARRATVADAAQALLHTRRTLSPDTLTEALAGAAHPRAAELLAELAKEDPSVLCRAVRRWAADDRPQLREAAGTYATVVLPHARAAADRELLRAAAEELLARPDHAGLHTLAHTVLLPDPAARARHLPAALRHFTALPATAPRLPALARALTAALPTHPEPVLRAFHARLVPGPADEDATADPYGGEDDAEAATALLLPLADVGTPALARRIARLVREYTEQRPLTSPEPAARFLQQRLRHGPAARSAVYPLVTGLLRHGPRPLRAELGRVLGRTGGPLATELLDVLLATEREPAVLDQVLDAVARSGGGRELVHRIGLLLNRTTEGVRLFDHRMVALARELPGFADQVHDWITGAPGEWAAMVGPSARREVLRCLGRPRSPADVAMPAGPSGSAGPAGPADPNSADPDTAADAAAAAGSA